MLAIQHAFAHDQQPAHIGIEGNELPQQDRDKENHAVRSSGIGASPSRPADPDGERLETAENSEVMGPSCEETTRR